MSPCRWCFDKSSDGKSEPASEVDRKHSLAKDVPTDQYVIVRGAGPEGSGPVVRDTNVLGAELQQEINKVLVNGTRAGSPHHLQLASGFQVQEGGNLVGNARNIGTGVHKS